MQTADSWGPYVVAIVVPMITILYQLLLERWRARKEIEKIFIQRSIDASLSIIGSAKAVADRWFTTESPNPSPELKELALHLKEEADRLAPLLPSHLRKELHTAAYHIWGLVEASQSKHREESIDNFGSAISELKKAKERLEQYLDNLNPMSRM